MTVVAIMTGAANHVSTGSDPDRATHRRADDGRHELFYPSGLIVIPVIFGLVKRIDLLPGGRGKPHRPVEMERPVRKVRVPELAGS